MARLTSDGLRKELRVPIGDNPGTAETSLLVGLGKPIHNDGIHLNPGAGVNNQVNLFRVYEGVVIRDLSIIVTTVTDTTLFDNVQFKAVSAGGSDDITNLNAAGATACVVGTIISRDALSGVAVTVTSPATATIIVDPALSVVYAPFKMLEQTAGVASYIVFEYDADAATDLIIDAHCLWSPQSDGGLVEVA